MQMKTNIEILVCIFLSLPFFQSVYEIFVLFIQYALLTSYPFFETETTVMKRIRNEVSLFSGTLYSWQKQL